MAGIQCWRKIEGKGEPLNSRNKHTAVVVGNRMLMFGGYSLQQRQFYNDITAFNFETKEWDDLNVTGQPPTKRRAHSCTVIGESQLIVFGGYNGDYCLNDVYTFDTVQEHWTKRECTGEVPPHRGGHTAVAWKNNCMVVHGGWDVGNVYYDCTYILHTDVWHWEQVKVTSSFKPVGRVGHTSVLHHDNTMFIFGGYGTDGYFDDLIGLNLSSGEWKMMEVVGDVRPCQRTFSSMEIVGNNILLFGGSNHDIEMNDVMLFNTEAHSWETVECPGQAPDGRFAHVSCMYNHKVYLYGGIVRGSGELTGMYELTLEKFASDASLTNLVKAWIVNSGITIDDFAECIPPELFAKLRSYHDEVLEVEEMERTMVRATPDFTLDDEAKEAEALLEDEDELGDVFYGAEEGFYEYDCESNGENWEAVVEDAVRGMLESELCTPTSLSESALNEMGPAGGCSSSSSSLVDICLSTSSTQTSLPTPLPTPVACSPLPTSSEIHCFLPWRDGRNPEDAPSLEECQSHMVETQSYPLDSPWPMDLPHDDDHSASPPPTASPPDITPAPSFRLLLDLTVIDGVLVSPSLSFGLPAGPWTGRGLQPLGPPPPSPDLHFECFPTVASISAP
eukprot:EG_transcript_3537